MCVCEVVVAVSAVQTRKYFHLFNTGTHARATAKQKNVAESH